jgi:hypothetical protein
VVKKFLDERAVSYEVRRVGTDAAAGAAFQARGWRLPPVVEVGDAAVEGYDPERLESLLDGVEPVG